MSYRLEIRFVSLRLQGQTFQIKKRKLPEKFGKLPLFDPAYTFQSQHIDFDLKQRVSESVIDKLSNLVLTQHLPPKILIIHQFRESMLPDWQNIRIKPGVEVVTRVDGFGTPEAKIGYYRIFDKQQLIQYPGFKLFYRWDQPLLAMYQ